MPFLDDAGLLVNRRPRADRQQLALAVPDVGNPTYVELMRGIESITRTSGYRLLVQSTGADSADEVSLIGSLGRRYVDGLIIVPIRITNELLRALAAATAPITVVTSLPDGSLVDNVRTDSGLGVTMVIEHMREAGRRSFALLNGPVDTVPGAERIRGFEAAMAAADMQPVAVECAEEFTYAAGLTAARRMFGGCRPDAVMCGNDLLAFAAIRALREHGLDVPRDVAVAGIVNATRPDRAYAEAIELAGAHQWSYGREAAGVFAAAVAQAMTPGATVTSVVDTCLEVARDGTRDAIAAVCDAAAGLRDCLAAAAELRQAVIPYDSVGPDYRTPGLDARRPSRLHAIEELPIALGMLVVAGGNYRDAVLGGVNYGPAPSRRSAARWSP